MRQYLVSKAKLRSLCAEISDDDGQPSHLHEWRKSGGNGRVSPGEPNCRIRDRKTGQLCRQVAQTLDEVLAECGDSHTTRFAGGERRAISRRIAFAGDRGALRRSTGKMADVGHCWTISIARAATCGLRLRRLSPASTRRY